MTDGTMKELHNPADMPDPVRIAFIEEPWIKATIFVPDEYLGAVLKLCEDRRGRQVELTYAGSRAMVVYRLPLNEVVFDFYDRLKSVSRGYASFDYHIEDYEEGDLVKMSILVNGEPVDALSMIVNRARAEARGRAMCEKLKELIPRHLFKIPIQAAIGGKIIARETIIGAAQGRDREMLRRRHHPQAQAPRQAERGQEEDAPVRQGRHSAGSLHRRPEDGPGLVERHCDLAQGVAGPICDWLAVRNDDPFERQLRPLAELRCERLFVVDDRHLLRHRDLRFVACEAERFGDPARQAMNIV